MSKRRLTQLVVDRLAPPAEGRVEIFDTVLPAFGLRISASGTRSWFVFYRIAGKQRRHTIGTVAVIPKLDVARDMARAVMTAADAGVDPRHLAPKAADPGVTMGQAIDDFIARYARPRNRDWATTEALLNRHVRPRWGARPAGEIRRADVHELLDGLADLGLSAGANRVLAHVRRLFGWLIERGVIDTSPVAGVKPPARETSRERVLSLAELQAVWNAAAGIAFPGGPFIRALLLLGQRRTQTARIRWSDITDLHGAEQFWRVPPAETKSGRPHVVPLPPASVTLFREMPQVGEGALAFSADGKRAIGGFSSLKRRLDRALPPDMPAWTLHDLRRSVATHLAVGGTPRVVIERLLDHADRTVTARYDRYDYIPEIRSALDQWQSRLIPLGHPGD